MSDTTKKQITTQSSKLDSLGDFYTNNPLMRALAALAGTFPLISALDEAVVTRWENAKLERFKILLDELSKNERYLTDELIQQEDFIYAFYAVTRAALSTRKKDKVHLFATLLTKACRDNLLEGEDIEDNIKILEDLSVRELRLLLLYTHGSVIFSDKQ